jgi:oxygen-independent coproporphyrinogen-3 oxidase
MSSLYLHIPFCAHKCPYCDFFSRVGSRTELDDYCRLLLHHIALGRESYPASGPLETIFFGGGTPSLLEAQRVAELLDALERNFGFSPGIEITLEANPGTLGRERLSGYRQAGVNRLSLGVQSLDDAMLRLLGRIHTVKEALDCIAQARAVGFDNLSLDLMFALPGQSLSELKEQAQRLLALEPEHLSLYGLSFEEGTDFGRKYAAGQLAGCNEELYVEQYHLLHRQAQAAGYEHYEISNFARSGHRCRHNQVYWRRQDCLAFGCGAHGFVAEGWGRRVYVPAQLENYRELLEGGENPEELLEQYDKEQAMSEYVYLALRTSDGIDFDDFSRRFSVEFLDVFAAAVAQLGEYAEKTPAGLRLKLSGWLIYDHLVSFFLC